jgi:hypothetical protein
MHETVIFLPDKAATLLIYVYSEPGFFLRKYKVDENGYRSIRLTLAVLAFLIISYHAQRRLLKIYKSV